MSLLGPRPPHLHLATVGAKVWLAVSSLLSRGSRGAARPHGYKAQGTGSAGSRTDRRGPGCPGHCQEYEPLSRYAYICIHLTLSEKSHYPPGQAWAARGWHRGCTSWTSVPGGPGCCFSLQPADTMQNWGEEGMGVQESQGPNKAWQPCSISHQHPARAARQRDPKAPRALTGK